MRTGCKSHGYIEEEIFNKQKIFIHRILIIYLRESNLFRLSKISDRFHERDLRRRTVPHSKNNTLSQRRN